MTDTSMLTLKALALLILTTGLSLSSANALSDPDSHDHRGHSDALLVILQHKIRVQTLQKTFYNLIPGSLEQTKNLADQATSIAHGLEVLQSYVAIPESRYPNLEMFHQSLISRAGLMKEYSELMIVFQNMLDSSKPQ